MPSQKKEKSLSNPDSESQTESSVSVIITKPQSMMLRPDGTFNEETFFELMGNDIRRKILSKISKFPRYASDLAIDLGVSKQAIKKHLDKLAGFGVVEMAFSQGDQKKQFYQISTKVALFAQIDLTPNYFSLNVENTPEAFKKGMDQLQHNPKTTLTSSTNARIDYDQLNYALKVLGQQLANTEEQINKVEHQRKQILMEKTILLNRIQMIINSLVRNDLEKEVIFSLFFDTKSTVEGLTLEEILDQLFLRKRKRAGVSKYKYIKTDPKTRERGQELLDLIQLLIDNFGFIRTENMKLFFDFEM